MTHKKDEKKKSPAHDQEKAENKELQKLKDQLEALTKEKDEIFGQLQRVSADYANYQKRAPKQIADSVSYEKEKIIKTLLPVLDNFDHTFQKAHTAESPEQVLEAFKIIFDQMLDTLKSHQVEPVEALNQIFDPSIHQAMMQQSNPEMEDNVILEEFQKGYKLNGRVIRPSKVIVNKLQANETPKAENTDNTKDTEKKNEKSGEGEKTE